MWGWSRHRWTATRLTTRDMEEEEATRLGKSFSAPESKVPSFLTFSIMLSQIYLFFFFNLSKQKVLCVFLFFFVFVFINCTMAANGCDFSGKWGLFFTAKNNKHFNCARLDVFWALLSFYYAIPWHETALFVVQCLVYVQIDCTGTDIQPKSKFNRRCKTLPKLDILSSLRLWCQHDCAPLF